MTPTTPPAIPSDIPEDLMANARLVATAVGAGRAIGAADFIARALLAAQERGKLMERERCAKVAVARSNHKRDHCDPECACDNGYHVAIEIKRGEAL